jgi:threonine 3-dehydrogenase
MITDINDYRLELAKKLGATKTINVKHQSLEEAMQEAGMVEGFDVALEMSGAPSALKQIFSTLRNGGKVALLGLFGGKQPDLDMDEIILKGATIQGIYGRKMYETWYKMAAMVQSGLDLRPLVTHHFPYTEYKQAFDIMNTGMSGKIILEWSK